MQCLFLIHLGRILIGYQCFIIHWLAKKRCKCDSNEIASLL